ncbi:NAD-dependent protein deacylase SRT2-like isoform X1 [Gossypium australe]|uniref:NAD-dependent protein deacylase n=1 Tax=Gossypium australe TaxID=47621 RepID=A0A5B6V5P4_9ROSI|nr:NAD-dependent protein deacylase SRT2-like isoform X1 [Gossypium australe]
MFIMQPSTSRREVLRSLLTGRCHKFRQLFSSRRRIKFSQGSIKFLQTSCRISVPGVPVRETQPPSNFLKDKKVVPQADPPSAEDVNHLYQLIDQSTKLVVLTGAGISTECGIPDYRSPNGAYSSGFKPITHQVMCWHALDNWKERKAGTKLVIVKQISVLEHFFNSVIRALRLLASSLLEFARSSRARRRYWARSYAGWRRFTAAQPGAAHVALASLEQAGRINFMITQNVDRLHHRAGSNPLELHGTVYSVICLDCGFSFCRNLFQDEVKALNPKWAAAIESVGYGNAGSDKSFGMKQRPDGDIEIDEKFWEEDFHIPTCHKCNGVLKPDVVFFGDNVPKERADKAMEVARECDAFLVLGSSVMTMSAFRLVRYIIWLISGVRQKYLLMVFEFDRAAHEAGASTAIVNIGKTRADEFVSLKVNARLGEILPRVLNTGSLSIPPLH